MKRFGKAVLAISAISMLGLQPLQVVGAATNYPYYATSIFYNGVAISTPKHIAVKDPFGTDVTSWLPMWYMFNAFSQMNIQASWDGNAGILNLQVPNNVQVDMSNLPSSQTVNSGTMAVQINGTTVEYAPRIAYIDPSSQQLTTYLPVYYLEKAMGRFGITASWDGTNWTMTTSSANSTGETQQDMANAMWHLFNATTLDIDNHATMQEAGVSPTTDTVTAGEIATWLSQWAAKSKGIAYGTSSNYIPYSLQYEQSSDPFTWAKDNDLYQGTTIQNSTDTVSTSAAQAILSNLQWWLNGSKMVGGKYVLHAPFFTDYVSWHDETVLHTVPVSQYQDWLNQNVHWYDQIQVWGSPTWDKIYVQFPNTDGVSGQYEEQFGIISKDLLYGYVKDVNSNSTFSGVTVTVPNTDGNPGCVICDDARILGTMNGLTMKIMYRNQNGQLYFQHPIDLSADQTS